MTDVLFFTDLQFSNPHCIDGSFTSFLIGTKLLQDFLILFIEFERVTAGAGFSTGAGFSSCSVVC